MRIPRYWSRATHHEPGAPPVTALGWSEASPFGGELAALIAVHDRHACGVAGLPLA